MKRKLGALEKVEADLPNLQYKIRRDPSSYRDDFTNQFSQYQSLLSLFLSSPTTTDDNGLVKLRDLIDFISHVADCYPDLTKSFTNDLVQLLGLERSKGGILDVELRDKIVGSLVLLRKKEIIDSVALLNVLWPLLISTPSKALRQLLFQKILSDIRTANARTTNHKLNRSVQQLCYDLIATSPESQKGLWATKLTRELWKRQVWTDAKAVSIMSLAAQSENPKVVVGGVRFFLGGDAEREEAAEEDSEGDGDTVDMRKLKHQAGVNKKSSKRGKELKDAAKKVKKKEKKKNAPHPLNFSALHLLHDPQGFAEKLFSMHLQPAQPKVKLNLEQRLLVLSLVTRLVGLHKLTLLPLYSYFLKYLSPKQPNVTSFLASLAQATHNLVPPDTLEPLIMEIANQFVSESSAGEVASAGLNGIREVCVRQPLAMNETLLQDLIQYRKSKDKGVQMAARGLLSLYRDQNPELLRKRDRGKDAAIGLRSGIKQVAKFGHEQAGEIEGFDLLLKDKEEQGLLGSDIDEAEEEEKGWDNWDAKSDSSESSGGWINVESDGESIEISDSEDEKPVLKKSKLDNKPGIDEGVEDKENEVSKDAEDAEKRQGSQSLEPQTALEKEEDRLSMKYLTTRILTPADLKKLHELRTSAAITANMPSAKRRKLQAVAAANAKRDQEAPLTADDIEGLASLSQKISKAEKIARAKGEHVDGWEKNDHRSTAARSKEKLRSEGKSTTNKEKARKKNFMMQLGKAKRKGKRSLTEQSNVLKAHVQRSKRGGKRGNVKGRI